MKINKKTIFFRLIKNSIPFFIFIIALVITLCTVIEVIFIQAVQTNSSYMPKVQQELKAKCIEKANFLNTSNNYIGSETTTSLLDIDNRESDKEIQWSQLYAIMAFHNMTYHTEINEVLLNEVAKSFQSTFKYEEITIKTKTTENDENGTENIDEKEEKAYILIESDTIIGHYKYNYEEKTITKDNTEITKKVFTNEELMGEKYERLRKYLKDKLHIRESDIETDIEIVVQASSGYYNGKENINWLQVNSQANNITDDKVLISKGMFIWPIPGYTNITSHYGFRIHPITGTYKLHSRS